MNHTEYIVKTLGSQLMLITQLQAAQDALQAECVALRERIVELEKTATKAEDNKDYSRP